MKRFNIQNNNLLNENNNENNENKENIDNENMNNAEIENNENEELENNDINNNENEEIENNDINNNENEELENNDNNNNENEELENNDNNNQEHLENDNYNNNLNNEKYSEEKLENENNEENLNNDYNEENIKKLNNLLNNDNFNDEYLENLGKEEEDLLSEHMVSNSSKNQQLINISNNHIVIESRNDYISTLRNEKDDLLLLFVQKSKELDSITDKYQQLRIVLVKKEVSFMETQKEISNLKSEIQHLKSKYDLSELINQKLERDNKLLNIKNIELNQKVQSLNSRNELIEKLQILNNKDDININDIINIELIKLQDKLDESQIENSKINFEKKNLENKLKNLQNEIENEILFSNEIHDNEIKTKNKEISYLQNQLSNYLNTINQKILLQSNELINKEYNKKIYNKMIENEKKVKDIESENFALKKEILNLTNDNDELTMLIDNKDRAMEKLKLEFEENVVLFTNKLNELENIISENENNNNENENTIKMLMVDNQKLSQENKILIETIEKLNKDTSIVNQLYKKRKIEHENKIQDYKSKIETLKIKINELHEEINILNQNQNINI